MERETTPPWQKSTHLWQIKKESTHLWRYQTKIHTLVAKANKKNFLAHTLLLTKTRAKNSKDACKNIDAFQNSKH